ncbi:MAG: hypothetical protein IPK73_04500 [Candidatus Obscuribacter sp.]|nr:hypothetical protein [Candidatus Obscuribacter sp.]
MSKSLKLHGTLVFTPDSFATSQSVGLAMSIKCTRLSANSSGPPSASSLSTVRKFLSLFLLAPFVLYLTPLP